MVEYIVKILQRVKYIVEILPADGVYGYDLTAGGAYS